MPQEYIIWKEANGWYGRYQAERTAGVTGPFDTAAGAAAAITADSMGSGETTSGLAIYTHMLRGGGGGGRSGPTTAGQK